MRTFFWLLLLLAFFAGSVDLQPLASTSVLYQVFIPLVSLDRDLIAFTNEPTFTGYPPPGWESLISIGVIQANGSGYRQLTTEPFCRSPSWSPDGTRIVYVSETGGFSIMNADGSRKTPILIGGDLVAGYEPDWSPSTDLIAFWDDGIHALELDKSILFPIPGTNPGDWNPALSPDGTRLAHTRYVNGSRKIMIQNLDGTGKYVLPNTPGEVYQPAWSPDGGWIAFPANFDNNIDIYRIHPDGTGLEQVTDTPWPLLESQPTWAPDGNRIAYTLNNQNESTFDVYVINVDGTGLRELVSNAIDPDWSP
jgi:Tol biopolymer transport system component